MADPKTPAEDDDEITPDELVDLVGDDSFPASDPPPFYRTDFAEHDKKKDED